MPDMPDSKNTSDRLMDGESSVFRILFTGGFVEAYQNFS